MGTSDHLPPDRDRWDPESFRTALLTHGAVLLRGVADRGILDQLSAKIEELYATYHSLPDERIAADDPEIGAIIRQQITISHVPEESLKRFAGISYFDVLRTGGVWDLAAKAFPEAMLAESVATNCRRISAPATNGAQSFFSTPISFHVDAQYHYSYCLNINFWTPLVSCGRDAPGLSVVDMGVAQTKSYLEFEPDRPILADRFNTAKMSMDALRANGLSQLVCSPELAKGDILAFTNFTMHSTYVTPAMTQSRIGVEARVDLKGFAF